MKFVANSVVVIAVSLVQVACASSAQTCLSESMLHETMGVSYSGLSGDGSKIFYQEWGFSSEANEQYGQWKAYSIAEKTTSVAPSADEFLQDPNSDHVIKIDFDDHGQTVHLASNLSAEFEKVAELDPTSSKYVWHPERDLIVYERTVRSSNPHQISPEFLSQNDELDMVFDTLHIREEGRDGRWLTPGEFRHLYLLDLNTGKSRALTSGEWSVGTYETGLHGEWDSLQSWSHDGSLVYFSAVRGDGVDTKNKLGEIFSVDVETGAIVKVSDMGDEQFSFFLSPKASPSGRYLAWLGYRWSEQHTYRLNRLWVKDLQSGVTRLIAPQFEVEIDPNAFFWSKDDSSIFASGPTEGYRKIFKLGMDDAVEILTPVGVEQKILDFDREASRLVILQSTPNRLEEIVVLDDEGVVLDNEVTPQVRGFLDQVVLPRSFDIEWSSSDGVDHRGVLFLPSCTQDEHSVPLIVRVHGGPMTIQSRAFGDADEGTWARAFTARGYAVFWPGYRGALGAGEAYANMPHDKRRFEQRTRDIVEGVDHVLSEFGVLDGRQVFLEGQSYGGLMASWLIGTTDRFKAAAVTIPFTNWISTAGVTDETAWSYARFEVPFWEDPTVWLETSPIMNVGRVTTPTMITIGERDTRTPAEQGIELASALHMAGQIPTRLVVLKDAGHGDWSVDQTLRYYDRVDQWFSEHSMNSADPRQKAE